MLDCTIYFSLWWNMVKMAIYTQKCEQKWLKINNRGVGIKMFWVEKNRKINNRGSGGDDYLGLESTKFQFRLTILKRVFPVENRKSEHYHWIMHVRISQGTKFHFKQTILNFGIKFIRTGNFCRKQKKWTSPQYSAYWNYSKYQISA